MRVLSSGYCGGLQFPNQIVLESRSSLWRRHKHLTCSLSWWNPFLNCLKPIAADMIPPRKLIPWIWTGPRPIWEMSAWLKNSLLVLIIFAQEVYMSLMVVSSNLCIMDLPPKRLCWRLVNMLPVISCKLFAKCRTSPSFMISFSSLVLIWGHLCVSGCAGFCEGDSGVCSP